MRFDPLRIIKCGN